MGAFCTNCGTPLPDGAGFCPKCGTKVETFCCPSCGKELDFGADFCIYCGQRLKEEAPMAEPEQEASAPPEETTSQSELKAPKEEKRSEPAEEIPTSEAAEPMVDSESPKEDPSNPEGPQEFTWAQKKPQGRAGSAITTVRLRLEQEMLHIQKEFSDTITSHKNTLPEETIPLSEIESVYIQKKGLSVSVILLFLCVALVLYGGVSGKFDFGTTAFCLLGLAVIIALRYRGQMKRYQMVIIEKNTKRAVLKGDDPQTMDEAAVAILTRAGINPGAAQLAEKRAGHKPIWIILGVVVVLLLGVLIVPELYLKQSFPAGVIQNQDVMDYVGTEINGDLNYQVTAEVTDGKLVKNTAMPKYEGGLFNYYFVDCVYDVTVKDDNGESVSGQVTVDCSFSVKPFSSKPEDIIFNGFTYSDEISQFVKKAGQLAADDLVGCWKLTFVEWADGEPYSGDIQSYFCIYDDSSFLYIDNGNVSGQGMWSSSGKALTILWSDNDDPRTGWIEDDKLYFQGPAYISQYEKLSPSPDAVWDIIGETRNNTGKSGSYIDTDYYTIDIPADWVGLFNCYEWKNSDSLGAYQHSLSFCEKGSEEDGYGGHVFSVELWRDESYTEGENYQLLGSLAATDPGRPPTLVGYIVITYPTDIQYSEAHAETYMKMYHETDDVLSSLTAKDGYALFKE